MDWFQMLAFWIGWYFVFVYAIVGRLAIVKCRTVHPVTFVLLPVLFPLAAVLRCTIAPLIRTARRRQLQAAMRADPHWETYPRRADRQIIGYCVRWSRPNTRGEFLYVGHYLAGEGASLAWCLHAAETHARRNNETKRTPWEFAR